MTQICFVEKKNPENPLRQVVKALLKERSVSQKELADYLDTEDANLSQRLLRGSMTSKMIGKVNEYFAVDVLSLTTRVRNGEPIEDVLKNKQGSKVEIDFTLSPEEAKEIIANQGKSMKELQAQLDQLMGQIKTWIQHDVEKSLKQEQLINTLLEERAEYKSGKKK
jgi:transcriptional regulator with XRE-family HTH domain